MAIKALLAFNSSDLPSNWNDRYRNIFKKGVYYGGTLEDGGGLHILIKPFVAISNDGMVLREDASSTVLNLAASADQTIGLRAKYSPTQPPSIEWLVVLTAALDLVSDKDSIIWFGSVITDGSGISTNLLTNQKNIKTYAAHRGDQILRSNVRETVATIADLPKDGVRDGELCMVADGGLLHRYESSTDSWIATGANAAAFQFGTDHSQETGYHSLIHTLGANSLGSEVHDITLPDTEIHRRVYANTGARDTGDSNYTVAVNCRFTPPARSEDPGLWSIDSPLTTDPATVLKVHTDGISIFTKLHPDPGNSTTSPNSWNDTYGNNQNEWDHVIRIRSNSVGDTIAADKYAATFKSINTASGTITNTSLSAGLTIVSSVVGATVTDFTFQANPRTGSNNLLEVKGGAANLVLLRLGNDGQFSIGGDVRCRDLFVGSPINTTSGGTVNTAIIKNLGDANLRIDCSTSANDTSDSGDVHIVSASDTARLTKPALVIERSGATLLSLLNNGALSFAGPGLDTVGGGPLLIGALSGDVTIGASNRNLIILGTLQATGNVTLGSSQVSTIAVTGAVTVTGTINVTSTAAIGSDMTVNGDVSITNAAKRFRFSGGRTRIVRASVQDMTYGALPRPISSIVDPNPNGAGSARLVHKDTPTANDPIFTTRHHFLKTNDHVYVSGTNSLFLDGCYSNIILYDNYTIEVVKIGTADFNYASGRGFFTGISRNVVTALPLYATAFTTYNAGDLNLNTGAQGNVTDGKAFVRSLTGQAFYCTSRVKIPAGATVTGIRVGYRNTRSSTSLSGYVSAAIYTDGYTNATSGGSPIERLGLPLVPTDTAGGGLTLVEQTVSFTSWAVGNPISYVTVPNVNATQLQVDTGGVLLVSVVVPDFLADAGNFRPLSGFIDIWEVEVTYSQDSINASF